MRSGTLDARSRRTGTTLQTFAVAAAARLSSGLADDASLALLCGSAAAWLAAFALFLLAYGPMLLRPRPGRHPQRSGGATE